MKTETKEKRILLASSNIDSYFRMRESFHKLTKEDLFHIPFHRRHLTQSNRFSLPGIPCIYLSNSLYLCWEELGRPSNKRLYAARFEYNRNNVRLINLSFIPQKVVFLNSVVIKDKPRKDLEFFLKESLFLGLSFLLHSSILNIEVLISKLNI